MLIQLIVNFLCQPLWWLGIVMTVILYLLRVRKERKAFRIAVNRDFYEGRHFVKKGFVFFVLGSIIFFSLGVMLPPKLLIIYQIVAMIAVLFSPLFDASLVAILGIVLYQCITFTTTTVINSSLFILIALFLCFRLLYLQKTSSSWFTPRIRQGKRGRRIAYYLWQEFTVFPVLLLIPGDLFKSDLTLWPLFSFGGHKFGLMLVPFLVGINCRTFKQSIIKVVSLRRKQTVILLIESLLFVGLSYLSWFISLGGLVFLALTSFWQAWQRHRLEQDAQGWYVETSEGVRVIAVQNNTPAAKMKLSAGDIILSCNDQKVTNETELYAAMQKNSAYCRFRVRNFAGEIKIAEGAIYSDAPHELGLILFH